MQANVVMSSSSLRPIDLTLLTARYYDLAGWTQYARCPWHELALMCIVRAVVESLPLVVLAVCIRTVRACTSDCRRQLTASTSCEHMFESRHSLRTST